jgi:protein phosphatase-4 regulatory subunit 3
VSTTNSLYLLTTIVALKFFRTCISMQDEFYNRQLMQYDLFEPILGIVLETAPKNNLLNSACLEFFEFIRRENIKPLIQHLVNTHRTQLESITYVDIFGGLIIRHEQNTFTAATTLGSSTEMDGGGFATPTEEERNGNRPLRARDLDQAEENYYNGSDEDEPSSPPAAVATSAPLVGYGSDEEEEDTSVSSQPPSSSPVLPSMKDKPPERISEKRRRERDDDADDDELGKLAGRKRRSSGSSVGSNLSADSDRVSAAGTAATSGAKPAAGSKMGRRTFLINKKAVTGVRKNEEGKIAIQLGGIKAGSGNTGGKES